MTRPIRICFVIDGLTRAGTETQLLALIRSLDRRRFAPSLVLLGGDDKLSRELAPPDCPVLRLGLRSLCSPQAVRAGAQLMRFWRQERIDIVQTYFLDSTYFAVPLARLSGVRRVLRVRNNLGHWLTAGHRALGRVMGRLVDATLTNCEPARQALLAAEGGPARKVIVLENGVDLQRFAPLAPPREPPRRIGVVANLRPVKGIDVFLRAAAHLRPRFPDVEFHVAGEGEQRPALERLAGELGLTNHCALPGAVADVPAFLETLDLVVVPSHAEGMSNALLEAMAAGRPVVATDAGANRHLLSDGELGVIVARGEPIALAEGIARLLAEPAGALRLARNAQRHVATHYSRDAMRVRFEQFYERLCA
jgi:glycosyltransferase involved in cell wall biosynthesis